MGLKFFKRRAQPAENAPEAHAVKGKSTSRPTPLPLPLPLPMPTTTRSPPPRRLDRIPTPHAAAAEIETNNGLLLLRLGDAASARRHRDAVLDELLAEQMRAQRSLRERARAMRRTPLPRLPPPPPPPSPVVVLGDISRAILSEDALRAGTRMFVPEEVVVEEDEDEGEVTELGNQSGRAAPEPLWYHPEALARLEGHQPTSDSQQQQQQQQEEGEEDEEFEICVVRNLVVIADGARIVDITPPRAKQMSQEVAAAAVAAA